MGILLNYGFGIAAYAAEWNRSPFYTILWAFLNLFFISLYAAYCLLRDKGLSIPTYVVCAISIVLSYGSGILLLALFKSIGAGIALLGVAFYYTYIVIIYFVYLKLNKSLPFFVNLITLAIIIITCFAIMIYAFVDDNFDDFYGFSITYLVINLMLVLYAGFRILGDMANRHDKPNFYSAYGNPIFKYNPDIKSVV